MKEKRFIRCILFLIIIVLMSCPTIISAKSGILVYKNIDDNVSIMISNDFYIFTHNDLNNTDDVQSLNISKEELSNFLSQNNILMYAINKQNNNIAFMIRSVGDSSIDNYNLSDASDEEYQAFMDAIKKNNNAINCKKYINHNKLVFGSCEYYDSSTDNYILEYYSIINGVPYSFTYQNPDLLTDEDYSYVNDIMNSISVNQNINMNNDTMLDYGKLIVRIVEVIILTLFINLVVIFIKKIKVHKYN